MRQSWFVGVFGGALAMSAAGGCDEGNCTGPRVHQPSAVWNDQSPNVEIPVDAAPWLLRNCDNRLIPADCVFAVDGTDVRVRLELTGADACDLEAGETVLSAGPAVIQRLRPRDPLPPGASVTLECAADDDEPNDGYYYYYNSNDDGYFDYDYDYDWNDPDRSFTLKVRDSAEPAAAPEDVALLELRYTRDDPNQSCNGEDHLEVKVDFEAQYLQEGGYVEVVYPNGEVFQFSRATSQGSAHLPASHGPLEFTPVAVDGERGETVVVESAEITEDLVYVPRCAVGPSPAPGELAALTGLTLLAIARRRRRKTGEASS